MEQKEFDADALNFQEPTVDETGNETPAEVVPVVEVKPEVVEAPKVETKPEIKISDPPSKFEGENDIQFSLRKQIYDAGQAKAQAETPEEQSALRSHIKGLRKELAITSKSSEAIQAPEKIEANESQAQESTEEDQAKEALRKMGYIPKDEVEAMVNSMVSNQSKQAEQLQAADEFYASRKDIASDPVAKQIFEDTIVARFNLTPQSSRADIQFAMEATANLLFHKTDTRGTRAATSADKRDLVSFSTNTQSAPVVSKADEKTAQGLKEIGMTASDMGWTD